VGIVGALLRGGLLRGGVDVWDDGVGDGGVGKGGHKTASSLIQRHGVIRHYHQALAYEKKKEQRQPGR
jgi:hypothetical protein